MTELHSDEALDAFPSIRKPCKGSWTPDLSIILDWRLKEQLTENMSIVGGLQNQVDRTMAKEKDKGGLSDYDTK